MWVRVRLLEEGAGDLSSELEERGARDGTRFEGGGGGDGVALVDAVEEGAGYWRASGVVCAGGRVDVEGREVGGLEFRFGFGFGFGFGIGIGVDFGFESRLVERVVYGWWCG